MIIGNFSVHCQFAEFVRTEVDNRTTVVGTYPRTLEITKDDRIFLPFGAYLAIQPIPDPGTTVTIRLKVNENNILTHSNKTPAGGEDAEFSSLIIGLSGSPLLIDGNTQIAAFLQIGDHPEAKVGQLDISHVKSG